MQAIHPACIAACDHNFHVQVPTQEFFTRDMGMPLYMEPNFEDLSCKMKFGQIAPPLSEDPVRGQSCFAKCAHSVPCLLLMCALECSWNATVPVTVNGASLWNLGNLLCRCQFEPIGLFLKQNVWPIQNRAARCNLSSGDVGGGVLHGSVSYLLIKQSPYTDNIAIPCHTYE
jgi:hypothetical protein